MNKEGALVSFSIGNLNINLQYSFFLVVSLFLIWDKTGWATLVLISVAMHELSHLLLMLIFHVKIDSLTFCPFGINIQKASGFPLSYGREALIYFAGPLCNLILAAAAWAVPIVVSGQAEYLSNWQAFFAVNLVMGLFQLVPILPLDGGQLLSCFAGHMLTPQGAYAFSMVVGLLLLTPIAVYAFLLFLRYGNFTLLVLSVALFWKNQPGFHRKP